MRYVLAFFALLLQPPSEPKPVEPPATAPILYQPPGPAWGPQASARTKTFRLYSTAFNKLSRSLTTRGLSTPHAHRSTARGVHAASSASIPGRSGSSWRRSKRRFKPNSQSRRTAALWCSGSSRIRPRLAGGVKPNDIILAADDIPIGKRQDLIAISKKTKTGPIVLGILRGGRKDKVTVVLKEKGAADGRGKDRGTQPFRRTDALDWSEHIKAERAVASSAQPSRWYWAGGDVGVVPESPAAKAKVEVNDILIAFAGVKLIELDNLVAAVKANVNKSVPLELVRAGKPKTIEIKPESGRRRKFAGPLHRSASYRRWSRSADVRSARRQLLGSERRCPRPSSLRRPCTPRLKRSSMPYPSK